jgi:hypothetical protein
MGHQDSAGGTMDNASLNAMHQDRHQADAYRRIELITGTVRRRRWTNDEKATIVAESTRPGVNIAEVARRFGVNRGLLQTWRRKAIGERPVFVPLRVEGLVAPSLATPTNCILPPWFGGLQSAVPEPAGGSPGRRLVRHRLARQTTR